MKEKLSDFAEVWKWTKLEEIVNKISNGITQRQSKDGKGIPVTRIETISNGTIDLTRVGYLNNLTQEVIEKYTLLKGDILFSHINSDLHLGKTAIFNFDNFALLHGMNLLLIRVNTLIIIPKFLNYLFNYYRFSGFFISIAQHAVNQSSINQRKLKNLPVPLLPLNEQNRIVEKIEELFSDLDKATEDLKKTQEQLKIYRQAVLKAAFEGKLTEEWRKKNNPKSTKILLQKIAEDKKYQVSENYNRRKINKNNHIFEEELNNSSLIPNTWKWTKINDISYDIQYGYTEAANINPIGPRFLRITDIQNNKVKWSKVPYCKINNIEKEKYILKNGDILFARTGATVGKSYLIKGLIPESIFASYLIRLKLSKLVNKLNVFYFFQSLIYWKQIKSGQVGTGQPNFNGTKLGQLMIPLCTYEEQEQIVQEIESRLSVCDKLEETVNKSLEKIKYLRQSILKKAFEGNLVPQNPEDEPADKLLERIKQEKERFELNNKKRKKR